MASLADEEDFPLVCGNCLGQNTFIRMMKDPNGGPCKVCNRPFTGFHWRPGGKNTRPKKTETCSTCARAKHLCQTCQLDLKFHLPAKVRDQALAPADRQLVAPPRSDATREYNATQTARDVASGAIDAVYNAPPINDIAHRLQRKQPNYRRNRPKVCTFFLENRCKKGKYCPFLHELPDPNQDPTLAKQNLVDRYHGTNDPVADRILSRKRRWEAPKPLSPPPPLPRPCIEDRHAYAQSLPRPVHDRPAPRAPARPAARGTGRTPAAPPTSWTGSGRAAPAPASGRARRAAGTTSGPARRAGDTTSGRARRAGGTTSGPARRAGDTTSGRARRAGDTTNGRARPAGGTPSGQARRGQVVAWTGRARRAARRTRRARRGQSRRSGG